jgi:Family of unknown function (DUF6535)
LQAGLYSTVLTGFLIDSKGKLKPDPTDRIEYYLQQHSTILSQISQQLASIAPQVSIPSTPPLPFPAFHPPASYIRVNIFWFTGLIFSLLSAFMAIVIQKWVRNNTDVFQRDSDPLKSARLRQYLREGFDQLHLPAVDETVPGFLHLSLILFFIGLGESLLDINTTVGLTTIVPIGFSGLLYIFTIFAPIIYPQSPLQSSISGPLWHLCQKLRWWKYWDGGWKPVSTNMEQGQMELAMEETEDRKARDGRAIRWLIGNQTEDAETEKLLMAIPGSFNSEWGIEVWRKISHTIDRRIPLVVRPSHHPPTHAMSIPPVRDSPTIYPHPATNTQGELIIRKLIARLARFLRTLEPLEDRERDPSTSDGLWRRGTRAFIETTATLLFFANARFIWFEDIVDLLGDIGSIEKTRELSLAGTDQLFVTRWTCLSLLAIRRIIDTNWRMWNCADEVLHLLEDDDTGEDNEPSTGAQTIDKNFQIARRCLYNLSHALSWTENPTEVKAILRDHESVISELERISIYAGHLENVDQWIFETQSAIAPQLTSHFPGILDDLDTAPVLFSHVVEMFRDPRQVQFIRPGQTLRSMCSIFPTLRSTLEGQWDADAYKQMLKNLMEFRSRASNWQGDELQRQLWRSQDLRNGHGFGFTVELYFLGLKQLLSNSQESHHTLYKSTFRAITFDWKTHKNSIGTQKLLLDIALSRSVDFQSTYPLYVANEFLELLGNIFEGQTGSHIDDAVRQLTSSSYYVYDVYRTRLLEVITRARGQSSESSRPS